MSDVVIRAEGLGKKYLIGHDSRQERYVALRDVLARTAKGLARSAGDMMRGRQLVAGDEVEEFWALKDVNFEISRGEVVGIIGRNGAGKSTLLKILSRITEPSAGRVEIKGRVASLLEVGTGFHPELTGRENVFLNGAILGMSRAEIRRKFDEILAFAEIEKFLDTPVKRYSSGMYVRLAFAVAAHLEPEILVVDEVLAVGDAEFQKKCLGKMHDVAGHGRTVLFVSHNLSSISTLSTRAVLLTKGNIALRGATDAVISRYLAENKVAQQFKRAIPPNAEGPYLSEIEVKTSEAQNIHQFGKPLIVRFRIKHRAPLKRGCFSFQILDQYGRAAVHAWAYNPEIEFGGLPGETELICTFPSLRLNVGHYQLKTYLSEPPGGELYDMLDSVCSFEVVRTTDSVMWDWRSEACVYFEDFSWSKQRIS